MNETNPLPLTGDPQPLTDLKGCMVASECEPYISHSCLNTSATILIDPPYLCPGYRGFRPPPSHHRPQSQLLL